MYEVDKQGIRGLKYDHMKEERQSSPGLFGIESSNKDFTKSSSWGKNQFNNTFPLALLNYMHSKGLEPVYIKLAKDFSIIHKKISVVKLYGIDPKSKNIRFAFEEVFEPYRPYVNTSLPRVDVVIQETLLEGIKYLTPLEVKLTALPDDLTSSFGEEDYGSEIVVRPDTIVYLALSFIAASKGNKALFGKYLNKIFSRKMNWRKALLVEPVLPKLVKALDKLMTENGDLEVPVLIQPVWKTKGKSTALAEECLDVFVWSNFALTRLFFNQVDINGSITRPERTVAWLAMMLNEFSLKGKMNHKDIIDIYTYNTKNDKAFALGGLKTREYMRSPELLKPRITRSEIGKIILNGGERLLSPGRRFDGIVQGTVDLFKG